MTNTYYGLNIDSPKTLYHYTSMDAMVSILDHASGVRVMATDCHFLNDDTEYKFGCDAALKWLSELPCMSCEFVDMVRARLKSRDEWGEFPGVTSFCAESDKTIQWMASSDHKEGGAAIGFKFKE